MFTPPPSEENVLIVQQSAPGMVSPLNRSLLSLGFVCALGALALGAEASGLFYPEETVLTEDVALEIDVLAADFPSYPVKAVPQLIAKLDEADSKLWKKNGEVLKARAPLVSAAVEAAPAVRFESAPLAPPIPVKKELVASSGTWLNGLVRISGSGLRLFSGGVAVFEKGGQRVVFQEGQVLPSGEVVISVDDRALLIETDQRKIQLIDDGA